MAKKETPRSFNDVISMLGSQRFDVAPAQEGARQAVSAPVSFPGPQIRLCRRDSPAPTAPSRSSPAPAVLGGEIAFLFDRGYQKFLKTSHLEIPATADHLRDLHKFSEELKQIVAP